MLPDVTSRDTDAQVAVTLSPLFTVIDAASLHNDSTDEVPFDRTVTPFAASSYMARFVPLDVMEPDVVPSLNAVELEDMFESTVSYIPSESLSGTSRTVMANDVVSDLPPAAACTVMV